MAPHQFPPFYKNQSDFHNEHIFNNKKISKLKSGQYPVWMTQKPRKGDTAIILIDNKQELSVAPPQHSKSSLHVQWN